MLSYSVKFLPTCPVSVSSSVLIVSGMFSESSRAAIGGEWVHRRRSVRVTSQKVELPITGGLAASCNRRGGRQWPLIARYRSVVSIFSHFVPISGNSCRACGGPRTAPAAVAVAGIRATPCPSSQGVTPATSNVRDRWHPLSYIS